MNYRTLIPGDRQLSATSGVVAPSVIRDAGPDAIRRFVEFFTANIRNSNTRSAYSRAIRRFCGWAERQKFSLAQVEPVLVAVYVEELQRHYGARAWGRSEATAAAGERLALQADGTCRGTAHPGLRFAIAWAGRMAGPLALR